MKWPKPMVLKCKTGLGAPAMGSGLFGFGPVGYLITLLAGIGVQYIVKQPSDIERLIASAVSEGAAGAVDKWIQACEGVSQPEPKCVSAEFRFSSHLSLGISITCLLISVGRLDLDLVGSSFQVSISEGGAGKAVRGFT